MAGRRQSPQWACAAQREHSFGRLQGGRGRVHGAGQGGRASLGSGRRVAPQRQRPGVAGVLCIVLVGWRGLEKGVCDV